MTNNENKSIQTEMHVVANAGEIPSVDADPIMHSNVDGMVTLTEEQAKQARTVIAKIRDSLSFFDACIASNKLMKSDIKTHMGLLRYAFDDLSGVVDNGETLSKELEETQALCRAANQRCRELETQLGKGISADSITAGLKRLIDLFEAWYELAGFHYASIEVNSYGVLLCDFSSEIELDAPRHGSPYHEALRNKVPYLFGDAETQRFDLHKETFRANLLDTDNNKALLARVFKSWFPRSRIYGYNVRSDSDNYYLSIQVRVSFADIEALDKESINY